MCGALTGPKDVTVRTAYVFFKCRRCGHIWEMPVPREYRMRK
jgi:hypothetical protein